MSDKSAPAAPQSARPWLPPALRDLLTPRTEAPGLPNRYRVREEEGERFLVCHDAPEIKVKVERGSGVAAGTARKADEGTIFLDGAAQAGPFLDVERRVFNLDHHEGCVRAFTLSTCEQALALVLRGLDLREKPWTLVANDPDLDTLLAIWVLLNAAHLRIDETILDEVAAVVRLEGVIDAHGSDLVALAGFEAAHRGRVLDTLEKLAKHENDAKREGVWGEIDLLQFAARQLYVVDTHFFRAGFLADVRQVDELARLRIAPDRLAIACRSDSGIYELESDLKRLYEKRLGVIVLDKGDGAFTLRQVDAFLPQDLTAAYDRLNLADPAVHAGNPENCWGGASDIGGSPRKGGSQLDAQQVTEIIALSMERPTWLANLLIFSWSLVATATLGAGFWLPLVVRRDMPALPPTPLGAGVVLALSLVLWLLGGAHRQGHLHGAAPPRGSGWLVLTVPAVAFGLFGGVWNGAAGLGAAQISVLVMLAVAAEVGFRGAVFAAVARLYPPHYPTRSWRLSTPVVISALLYAALTGALALGGDWTMWRLDAPVERLLSVPAAFGFALAAGLARHRSGSLLAPIVLHLAAAMAVLAIAARG